MAEQAIEPICRRSTPDRALPLVIGWPNEHELTNLQLVSKAGNGDAGFCDLARLLKAVDARDWTGANSSFSLVFKRLASDGALVQGDKLVFAYGLEVLDTPFRDMSPTEILADLDKRALGGANEDTGLVDAQTGATVTRGGLKPPRSSGAAREFQVVFLAGVVYDSQPEREYRECLWKAAPALAAFCL